MYKYILLIFAILSISTAFSCYQESANTSNQSGIDGACGQVYTGNYLSYGLWSELPSPNLTFDGNYSTYDLPAIGGNATLEINYTKPNLANSSSLWQVKFFNTSLGGDQTINITIPVNCWSQNPLQLRAIMGNGEPSYLQCYNGTAFQNIGGSDAGIVEWGRLYEEGMFWQIGCGTINVAGQYDINGDLSAGSCLTIATSNVNLNCNGNMLESTASGAGNFIITASNVNNLTVRNCKLKWLSSDGALALLNTTTVNVLNNTLIGQFNDLIEVDPAQVSSNLLIANNSMIAGEENRSSRLLWLRNTNNVQILTNQINPSFGCQQIQGDGNNWTITSNTLITPTNFSVGCLPNNSTFINATLTNSTISYNNVTNFSLFNSYFTTSNITGNRQNGAERSRLDGNGNIFQLNYFQQSNTTLIRILGSSNLFYNNYFSTNDSTPFLIVGSSNLWNTTLTAGTNILGGSNIGGNFYSGYTGHDCDNDGIGDTQYNISSVNIDYLPLTNDNSGCGGGGGGGGGGQPQQPSEPTPTTPTASEQSSTSLPQSLGELGQQVISNPTIPVIANSVEQFAPNIITSTFKTCSVRKTGPLEIFRCEYEGILGLVFFDFISLGIIVSLMFFVLFTIFIFGTAFTRKIGPKLTFGFISGTFGFMAIVSIILTLLNNALIVFITKSLSGGI